MKTHKIIALTIGMLVASISHTAIAQDNYGVMVGSTNFDSNDAYSGYSFGVAYNHPTEQAALDRAIQQCYQRGGQYCTQLITFSKPNLCASVAISANSGEQEWQNFVEWAAAKSTTKQRAKQLALNKCENNINNHACKEVTTHCMSASADATPRALAGAAEAESTGQDDVASQLLGTWKPQHQGWLTTMTLDRRINDRQVSGIVRGHVKDHDCRYTQPAVASVQSDNLVDIQYTSESVDGDTCRLVNEIYTVTYRLSADGNKLTNIENSKHIDRAHDLFIKQ